MSSESETVLITGASGNVGAPLVRRFLASARSYKLVLPTRSRSKLLDALEIDPNSQTASSLIIPEGDVYDPNFLEDQLKAHSVTSLVLTLTGADEFNATLQAFEVLSQPGVSVKRLVYLSAAGDFSPEAVLRGALKIARSGILAIKFAAEQALAYGGPWPFTWTVLGPTLFHQNDIRFNKANWIREKAEGSKVLHYAVPVPERGTSMVDVEDIALAAFNVLEDGTGKWHGKKVTIGSRKMYTLTEVKKLWSDALGEEVVIPPNTREYMDTVERALSSVGTYTARNSNLLYSDFHKFDFGAQTEEEYQLQVDLLGKEPNSYEAWVKYAGEKIVKEFRS